MQKQVTAKRSEIDALMTEIHWLKECVDIARKVMGARIQSLIVGMWQAVFCVLQGMVGTHSEAAGGGCRNFVFVYAK